MIIRYTKTHNHKNTKPNDSAQSSQKTKRILSADKLTESPLIPYPVRVDAKHRQTAKFWDSNSLTWRQHRQNLPGGFFSPVECVNGFVPGIRRLQDDSNRNKRVVFHESHSSTRQLCPTRKTQHGAVTMTAIIPMGNLARRASAHLTIGGAAA